MPIILDTNAIEESTYIVTVTLKDQDDNLITPNTLVWSLTDEAGNVVNSRLNVAVSTPSSSESIALTRKDLSLPGASRTRIITFEATYDGSLGTNLTLKESARFTIDDLVKVEYSSASSSSSSESSSSSASSSSSSQSSSSSSESSSSSSAT